MIHVTITSVQLDKQPMLKVTDTDENVLVDIKNPTGSITIGTFTSTSAGTYTVWCAENTPGWNLSPGNKLALVVTENP